VPGVESTHLRAGAVDEGERPRDGSDPGEEDREDLEHLCKVRLGVASGDSLGCDVHRLLCRSLRRPISQPAGETLATEAPRFSVGKNPKGDP